MTAHETNSPKKNGTRAETTRSWGFLVCNGCAWVQPDIDIRASTKRDLVERPGLWRTGLDWWVEVGNRPEARV